MQHSRAQESSERGSRADRSARERTKPAVERPAPAVQGLPVDRLGNRAVLELLRSGQWQGKAHREHPGCATAAQVGPMDSAGITDATSSLMQRPASGGILSSPMPGVGKGCGTRPDLGTQDTLLVNEPGDRYELEADRIADRVMATPLPTAFSSAPLGIQRFSSPAPGSIGPAPVSVEKVLIGSGKPLEAALQVEMEQRFGHDFSHVRVHSGAAAEQSAREMDADAYTLGPHIVFAAGKFSPTTHQGRRLIAHELTHVVQHAYNQQPVLHRQKANKASPVAAQEQYYVVGDSSLNLGGGVLLKDLESLRKSLLATTPTGDWTLTITMHGSEKFFGLTAGDVTGGLTENDPKAYNASRIKAIFADKDFQAWRKTHGPMRINLLSCAIGRDLEDTFRTLVQHPASKQRAIGLGAGCYLLNTPIEATINDIHIASRKQYNRLSAPDQQTVLETLTNLNNTYGYSGTKVKPSQILDYYFTIAPKGLWIKVEVLTTKNTQVPYLGREANSVFLDECEPRGHRPRSPGVPTVGDEELDDE